MATDNPDQPLLALYAAICGATGGELERELRNAVDQLHVMLQVAQDPDVAIEQVRADRALFDELARWCLAKRDKLDGVLAHREQEVD